MLTLESDVVSALILITFSPVQQSSSEEDIEGEGSEEEESYDATPLEQAYSDCCPLTRYQSIVTEFTHTAYICMFISHRTIRCISRDVDSSILDSFTNRYALFYLLRIELNRL